MRKALSFVVLALVSIGCQPKVIFFNAQPPSAPVGPVKVTLNWKLSAGTAHLSADQPVMSADQPATPALDPPLKVSAQGSKKVEICKTTTFKLELHYGGERTLKVPVTTPCDAPVPCTNKVLTFTGTCPSALQGPTYGPQTVNANGAPGNLKDLFQDADFPIHVIHSGSDISLGAGGGPQFPPLPVVPAAGDYQIYVPGQLGINICQEATSPVGGGSAEAPPVHLTVVPTCPTP